MAITYPVSLADLFDRLAIVDIVFDLGESLAMSETGGGDVILSDHGSRLWYGTCQLIPMRGVQMDQVDARLTALRRAGRPFLMTRPDRSFPAADLDGRILGSSVPVIGSIAANNRVIDITGLPSGYVLTAGDFLSFDVSGVHHLHKVVDGGLDGVGIEVEPEIRGNPVGAVVVLERPTCKAIYAPKSYRPPVFGAGYATGPAFSWSQTLR